MSHVSSSDSLNGRCTSSDLSKDPARPSLGPEGPLPGPGPVVVQRSSPETSREPGAEEESVESPMSNGGFVG